jgi:hypothetical protein
LCGQTDPSLDLMTAFRALLHWGVTPSLCGFQGENPRGGTPHPGQAVANNRFRAKNRGVFPNFADNPLYCTKQSLNRRKSCLFPPCFLSATGVKYFASGKQRVFGGLLRFYG